MVSLADTDSPSLLVKGDVARAQLDKVSVRPPPVVTAGTGGKSSGATAPVPAGAGDPTPVEGRPPVPAAPAPTRFYGEVALNPARVGRDAGRIAEEVIAHLAGLIGADVKVTLQIEAESPRALQRTWCGR